MFPLIDFSDLSSLEVTRVILSRLKQKAAIRAVYRRLKSLGRAGQAQGFFDDGVHLEVGQFIEPAFPALGFDVIVDSLRFRIKAGDVDNM